MRYLTGWVNYSSFEEAYRVFKMLPEGTNAALDNGGTTINYLQDHPRQHGQQEFKGSDKTMYLIVK